MGYSVNLVLNPDALDGLNDWTSSNITVVDNKFVLSAAGASMYQTRDMSLLDFIPKGFRIVVVLEYASKIPAIADYLYFKAKYEDDTYEIVQVPLRSTLVSIELTADIVMNKKVVSVEVGAVKNSTPGTIKIDSIQYFHDDNPFTYGAAEVDKSDNSIITDAYGIHIYDGNAFDGAERRVTLGEYDVEQFGLLIKGKNAETIINEFGINPKFLDYSKNLTWNSSFEVFDANNKPLFWFLPIGSDGECSTASTFYSDRSLRLGAGSKVYQTWAARVKPWWINNQQVRVSMYVNFVQSFKVRIVDIGHWEETGGIVKRYYLLTDNNGNTGVPVFGDDGAGSELTFTGSAGWEDSRITFTFNSGQYPSDSISNDTTAFAIEIENVGTGDIYIDGVMAHVDFTGQWAQLYKDGPKSISTQMIGNYWTNPDVLTPEEAEFEGGGGGGASSADQVSYNNSTTGMTATNVQDGIDELFTSVSDGKVLLANAITDRGIYTEPTETFAQMAAKILLMLKMIQAFAIDKISLEAEETVNDLATVLVFNPSLTSISDYITYEDEETVSDSVTVEIT